MLHSAYMAMASYHAPCAHEAVLSLSVSMKVTILDVLYEHHQRVTYTRTKEMIHQLYGESLWAVHEITWVQQYHTLHLCTYYNMLRAASCQTQANNLHLVCHVWVQVYHATAACTQGAEHKAHLHLMEAYVQEMEARG